MRTNNIKYRLLYLFVLLGFTISFNSCTSDDNDDILSQTWLEKYDGTKWVDDDELLHWRINDNMSTVVETYYHDGPCYAYGTLNLNQCDDIVCFEIIENSTSKFVVQADNDGEIETMTFTVKGNTLTLLFEGVFANDESIVLHKTFMNFDEFTICEEIGS